MKKLAILNILISLCIVSYAQVIVDPVADTIEICKGDTTQLEINVTGGTGSYTYTWFPSLGLSDSTIANPYAFPDTTTLYSIIVTDGSSDDTSQILIVVHEPPVADAGIDQTIPSSTTTFLNGSASGGSGYYLYNWQPAEMLSDTNNIQNPQTIIFPCVQEFILIVTDSITGCQDEDGMLVNLTGMTPVEIVAIPNKICKGDTSHLSIFDCETWISYSWTSVPSGLSSSEAEIDVCPNDTTIYIIDIEWFYGMHYYDSIVIPVVSPPLVQFNLNVTLSTVSFSNQSQNATTYLWDFGDGNTDTTENPMHTYLDDGTYTVTLYASNECFSDSIQHNIIITDIQINSGNSNKKLTINPNPAKYIICINGLDGNCTINLYDSSGKKMIKRKIYALGTAEFKLDSNIDPGHYILECITKDNIYRESVIIQKQ